MPDRDRSRCTLAVVEQQRQDYQPGQPITAGQERDLVYVRRASQYALALRRVPTANGESETRLYASDINARQRPQAVFVTPAPNTAFGTEYDVVETTGAVTLIRQLPADSPTWRPAVACRRTYRTPAWV